MGSLEIRPVHSTGDLRRFLRLPYRLYRDEPNWVAPLRFERRQFLDRRKNPFFEHGRAEYFLALRDGRVVGRVSAQVDDNFQAFQENKWGWFGFFECENDPEAARALLDRADQWLRGQGCDRMVGPADFTTNDECGVLLEGHDRTPLILSPWTHRYYPELLEGAGMAKAMDLLMWELHISGRDKVNPVIWKLADQVEARHGVVVRPFRKKDIESEISRFMEVYNSAWERNWGFVPMTRPEFLAQAKDLKKIAHPALMHVAEVAGAPVGFVVALPDVNVAARACKGRLLPFGWLRFLRAMKKVETIRVITLGILPQWRRAGIEMLLMHQVIRRGLDAGFRACEASWILEDNRDMLGPLEQLGHRPWRRYRIYEKALR